MLAEEYAAWLARQNTSVARDSLECFLSELQRQFASLERRDLDTVLERPLMNACDMAGLYVERVQ